jgi:DNA-binding MarR family transcriptional regulator
MSGRRLKGGALPDNDIAQLYRRPGFMIRRAHQIAVALFLEETGELGITTTQYGILFLLSHQGGIDQVSVAKLLGLDRSTTGMVVQKLEAAGLIGRGIGAHDRRRRSLHLTRAGEAMLARLAQPAKRAQARILSVLSPDERTQFLAMLDKLTHSFNGTTRVPLQARPSAAQADSAEPRLARKRTAKPRSARGSPRKAKA